MRIRKIGSAVGITAALVAASLAGAPASGAPKPVVPQEPSLAHRDDNLPNPLAESKSELTKQAIAAVVSGKAKAVERNGSQVVRLGGRWAELKKKADKVDPIFVVLSQFSDTPHPVVGGAPGPQKNEIPQPDRAVDNSTYWESDFNQAHFDKLYNGDTESVADFYYQQSGAKYTTKAAVSDWVQVPYNEARYGSNNYADSSTYWPFIKDSANAWYNAQIAAGKSPAEIADYLKQFDIYDRYDADGDGNFNEPDGYIDHFQAVHAGEGEEAGGGAQGADAIWSHRWYAYSNGAGTTGPAGALLGGTQIGTSGIWIGDYTIQPENGGLGVFAHEFGHDLGLPDLYDTAGGDNSTSFWTLMSGGSWMSHSATNIGTSPVYMGPWEKLFLGWLDYTVVENGTTKMVSLGSAATPKGLPQAVLVPLPTQTLTTEWNTPFSGSYEWWGGSADGLSNTLTRTVDLTGATTATLSAKVQYDIETDYDYLYGEVSTNGGASWTQLGQLDGSSNGAWEDLSYDLSAYAGQVFTFRFRYATDGGVHYSGPFLDNIALTTDGAGGFSDDVEAGVGGWTASGFTRFGGTSTRQAEHFYLAEYRSYTGYDKNLKTGPYNFVGGSRPDWVEKFAFQDGLLVWYVNYAYDDNNTSAEGQEGHGQVLPVDARPAPLTFSDGSLLGNRRQPFDATFGLQKTDAVTFHRNDMVLNVPSKPGIPTFDDSDPNRYWSAANPLNSVKVAGDGVKISMWLEVPGTLPVVLLQVKN
ncbi:immune inhibitor A [Catellatospora sp. KI3]|uniref:immune inhibitor A domain-containing protein n=1 Tax=Catellatospora sp. KI3 TaxID=3041620 RepID=UPI0024832116|nr:immune inhibitor A domain-containing protein [Catellatospora sp. KI3]MDI1461921.1 immune inhibitor A [Catellatospora sp. KI3]